MHPARIPSLPPPEPPLLQYWHAGQPPGDVARLIEAIRADNPERSHLLFDRAGGEALIETYFSAREVAAFRSCAVPAMQADYLRYCATFALGGTYVDADFRSVAPLRSLLRGVEGGLLFGRPGIPRGWPQDILGDRPTVGAYRMLANSFFHFPRPRHPLLGLTIEIATSNIERRIAEDVAVATGPCIFTSLYMADQLGSLEAFREHAGGILDLSADLFCEQVGSHERVAAAFEDVRVAHFADSRAVVSRVGDELGYRSTKLHWTNYRQSIYR